MQSTQRSFCNFWQIWNLCFGFIGIQFGFALQNANASRIFQSLGASIDEIPLLWLAAPITGLLLQPLAGFISDRTWTKLGRRRPFLLTGTLVASISLAVTANAQALWVAVTMIWLLNIALNISLAPTLALVGDTLPAKQLPEGFAVQSFFIGISAVAASALPWLLTNIFGFNNLASEGEVPASVVYSFYAGGVIMLLSTLWTTIKTKETPPLHTGNNFSLQNNNPKNIKAENFDNQPSTPAILYIATGLILNVLIYFLELDPKLHIITICIVVFGILKIANRLFESYGRVENIIYRISHDLSCLPKSMQPLAAIQFLSWFALFCVWMYATSAVTSYHFGTSDPHSPLYNQGANWVGILFATYNACAALAAFTIPWLVKRTNQIIAHSINLSLGGFSLLCFLLIEDPTWLLLPMIGLGFAWASILTLPYSILTSTLPTEKRGVYAGLFNVFIVLPQILASSILAFIINHIFAGETIYVLSLAGASMLCAAFAGLMTHAKRNTYATEWEAVAELRTHSEP